MPRFSIKWLLMAFAVIALWQSSLTLSVFGEAYIASDIRRAILMVVGLSVVLKVIYSVGKRRAFWLGFLLTSVAIVIGEPSACVPRI